jgi:hypothetical protein
MGVSFRYCTANPNKYAVVLLNRESQELQAGKKEREGGFDSYEGPRYSRSTNSPIN